jgi:hypothetical protein
MFFGQILWSCSITAFLSKPDTILRLIYYQYSVTLPLYGLQPIERYILNVIVIFSVLMLFRIGLFHIDIAMLPLKSFLTSSMIGAWETWADLNLMGA